MERTFGVVTTSGYLTFTLDTAEGSGSAVDYAYRIVTTGESEIYGTFSLPGVPRHAQAGVRLNPAHVVAVIELPKH
jgi:hypothetical protein